jgi:hypothetical protein
MRKKSQIGLKMLQEMQTRLHVPKQIQSLFRAAERSSQTNGFSFTLSILLSCLKKSPSPFVTIRENSWAKNSPCAVQTF